MLVGQVAVTLLVSGMSELRESPEMTQLDSACLVAMADGLQPSSDGLQPTRDDRQNANPQQDSPIEPLEQWWYCGVATLFEHVVLSDGE